MLREPACGNTDTVFMDVYLSVSPTGSSHFPLGNTPSAHKKFFMGSKEAVGQLRDRHIPRCCKANKEKKRIPVFH